jgi:hypothetical protein
MDFESRRLCKYFTGCALGALLGTFESYSWMTLGEKNDKLIANACLAGWQTADEWHKMLESARQGVTEEIVEEFNEKVNS